MLLERLENDEGMVVLSKEKAAQKQNWEKIVQIFNNGGLITGKVKAVVKGGLMLNVGVEAFLPGSARSTSSRRRTCAFTRARPSSAKSSS